MVHKHFWSFTISILLNNWRVWGLFSQLSTNYDKQLLINAEYLMFLFVRHDSLLNIFEL